MCEIVLIYYLQKQIGETYERSGRDSTLIRVLFVVSWIFAELFCVIVGAVVTGEPMAGYLFGIGGIVCVCVIFFVIANSVPTVRRRERGYMDYYHEYRETGDVRISRPRRRRRRREDPEDEDDPPPRRPRDDEQDEPPRRRASSREDEEEDDRPRRGGFRRDEEDEPQPRPRRRSPREDEDY